MDKDQITLSIDEFPTKWYNIMPDLPEPLPPPMQPETGPSRMEYLAKTMVKECLGQEMSTQSWITIPEEIRELYVHMGRPRPLYRAKRLEKKLGLKKVRLYYKREDLSPTGSHKTNTAIAQAYYAMKEGKTTLSTETGAGQWGTALSYAASLLGLKCVVFWVKSVFDWKTDRRTMMKLFGAEVYSSPSNETKMGREINPLRIQREVETCLKGYRNWSMAMSSWSPALWPWTSLTCLKLSRSMNSSATLRPVRRA